MTDNLTSVLLTVWSNSSTPESCSSTRCLRTGSRLTHITNRLLSQTQWVVMFKHTRKSYSVQENRNSLETIDKWQFGNCYWSVHCELVLGVKASYLWASMFSKNDVNKLCWHIYWEFLQGLSLTKSHLLPVFTFSTIILELRETEVLFHCNKLFISIHSLWAASDGEVISRHGWPLFGHFPANKKLLQQMSKENKHYYFENHMFTLGIVHWKQHGR